MRWVKRLLGKVLAGREARRLCEEAPFFPGDVVTIHDWTVDEEREALVINLRALEGRDSLVAVADLMSHGRELFAAFDAMTLKCRGKRKPLPGMDYLLTFLVMLPSMETSFDERS